ncbi:MAG: PEP-CTERM sorting domain-containing protein [Verrucomicrobiota bacterium]
MTKTINKLVPVFIIIAFTLNVRAQLVVDFTSAGANPATSTLTVDILEGSAVASGTNNPGTTGAFSTSTATGTFEILISPVGDPETNSFEPLTWGGIVDTSTSFIDTNNSGWGVSSTAAGDGGNTSPGEALLFSFDLSGLSLGVDERLVWTGFTVAGSGGNNTVLHIQTSATSGSLVATGTPGIFNQIISNGDLFALSATGSGQKRFETATFDIVTIPEPSTVFLTAAGVGALLLLRGRSSKK